MSEHVEGEIVSAQEGPQEGWLISYVAQRLQVSPKRVRNLVTAGTLHPVPGTVPVRLSEDSVTAYEAKRVRKVEEGRQAGLTWEQLDTGPVSPYVALSALVVEACEQIGKLNQSVEVLKRSQERLSYEVSEALAPKPRAIGAGPRKATTTVRRDDVQAAMRTLARHYTTAELADALRALGPEEVITGSMRLAGRQLQEDRDEAQGTS
jgi:hypothetical protein